MREFCLGCDTNLVRSISRKVLQSCSATNTDLLSSAHFQFEQCKIYVLSQIAINAPFLDRSRNRKPKHFGAEFFPRNFFSVANESRFVSSEENFGVAQNYAEKKFAPLKM